MATIILEVEDRKLGFFRRPVWHFSFVTLLQGPGIAAGHPDEEIIRDIR